MDHVNYFKDLVESISDYKKIVLIIIVLKNNEDLISECGFLSSDIISLNK